MLPLLPELPPPYFLPPGPAPPRCACARANTWLPRSQSSNGGGWWWCCGPPVPRGGPLRFLPAEPGVFRFSVYRRSPASVGDSQQPATPGVRAFRAPQRYLHLPGHLEPGDLQVLSDQTLTTIHPPCACQVTSVMSASLGPHGL